MVPIPPSTEMTNSDFRLAPSIGSRSARSRQPTSRPRHPNTSTIGTGSNSTWQTRYSAPSEVEKWSRGSLSAVTAGKLPWLTCLTFRNSAFGLSRYTKDHKFHRPALPSRITGLRDGHQGQQVNTYGIVAPRTDPQSFARRSHHVVENSRPHRTNPTSSRRLL